VTKIIFVDDLHQFCCEFGRLFLQK